MGPKIGFDEIGSNCSKCDKKDEEGVTDCTKGCKRFKLFGVEIEVREENGENNESSGMIRKSKSMGNLPACDVVTGNVEPSGYVSDGFVHQSSKCHERKKGKPWSEEEHRSFLVGLQKLGKGDWKGIAKNYVPSRTSSQVASHAQKHFIRKAAAEKKRRRASVFDIPIIHEEECRLVSPLKNPSESIEVQASLPTPIATVERPPLPITKRGIHDFHNPYMPRTASFPRGFPIHGQLMPTVSWVPVVNFPNYQNDVFLPPNCMANIRPLPSTNTIQHQLKKKSSQETPATNNNDELNINIRNLKL